jgi:hypothetical protein
MIQALNPGKFFSPSIFPTPSTHAYNLPASVAEVFRETFAGRRGPAPWLDL